MLLVVLKRRYKNEDILNEFLTLFSALSFMKISTTFMIDSFIFISFLLNVGETFLSIFLISVVNSFADIFGTIALTKSGFEVMAFMAIIPSQFFNLMNGISLNLLGSDSYYFNILNHFYIRVHNI